MNLSDIKSQSLRARIEDALGAQDIRVSDGADGALDLPATGDAVARHSPESDLDDAVGDYCREHGWYVIRARTDRKSTLAKGTPDYAIFAHGGRTLFLELKRKGGKATTAQQAAVAHLTKLGHLAYVVDNWNEALKMLQGL